MEKGSVAVVGDLPLDRVVGCGREREITEICGWYLFIGAGELERETLAIVLRGNET